MNNNIGNRYGKLVIIENMGMSKYLCKCDCGNEKIICLSEMKRGRTKSCGCISREKAAQRCYKHGMLGTPTYTSWYCARNRCVGVNNKTYIDYGGRGIKMCDRWLNSFQNFLDDMGERPSKRHSIDRINNDGNYEPSNCRWATRSEQLNNQRRNILITYKGKTQTMAQWSKETGIKFSKLSYRLKKGLKDDNLFYIGNYKEHSFKTL